MVEVAEIFRAHGPEYLAKYGERMSRAHLRAMRDIEQCRTPVLGGQARFCTVSAEEFMRRFLQHVLPERFVKVRYYGLLSPGNRHLLK